MLDAWRCRFFITVCCAQRGINSLATRKRADAIRSSLAYRQSVLRQWWIHLFLIMPDDAHGLVTFARQCSLRRTVPDWKRFLARRHSIHWQADFFDHRLRNEDEMSEKWSYIVNNPMRAGLASAPERWPYAWTADQLEEPNPR